MNQLNRRNFLGVAAGALANIKSFAQPAAQNATLTLHAEKPGPQIPPDFIGLSYEMLQIVVPDFFSPANKELIAQFQALAPRGMLRMGGNTSDSGYWEPTADAPIPQRRPNHPFGEVKNPDIPFAITPDCLHRLRGFLDAVHWKCIYGINLGTNFPSIAADEAVAATEILGPRLECIQIGNEADRFGTTFRRDPKTWGPEAYYAEWRTFAEAIVARVPEVRLGMPDLAAKPEWFAAVVSGLENDAIRRHVITLTYHYYVDGPPSNPLMDIPHMLHSNDSVLLDGGVVRDAAAKLHTTWRMTEGNSCWNGGKRGVSDAFAAALWSADYALLHASMGCAGINLHGGDSRLFPAVAGGKLPDDDYASPAYTPISYRHGRYIAEPVSYGLRFAGMFAGGTMIPVDLNAGAVNANAYAAKMPDGKTIVAVINKDATQALHMNLPKAHARMTLQGPALNAPEASIITSSTGSIVLPGTATLFQLT